MTHRPSQEPSRTAWYPSSRGEGGRMAHRFAVGDRDGCSVTVCDERVQAGNRMVRGDDRAALWCPTCFPLGAPKQAS